MSFMERFFSDTFMPHGYCFQWRADILWTNVISDFLIAFAYFTIPIAIILVTRRRNDIEFKGIFVLFALFILCCGITHLMSIYTMWHASYGLHGVMKAITAIVSLYTAFAVYKNLGKALTLPSPAQLEEAIKQQEAEKSRSAQLEIQRKAEAIFRFTTELIPTGLLVVDANQKIVLVNKALNKMFGYDEHELEGQDFNILLEPTMSHHSSLFNQYIEQPEQFHRMAAGRVVRGTRKDSEPVDIQISLAVHDFESEKHAFASVTDFGSLSTTQAGFDETNLRIQRAIDASNDGIWEWNVQTGEVWYSPQLMKLIGRRKDEKPLLDHWRKHIHPDDWPSIESAIDKHFNKEAKFDVSYRGRTESGDYEWFHTRGDTLFDGDNNPLLMSGTLSNINDLKVLEEKLEEQSIFLDQVLKRSLTGMYIFDLKTRKNTYINPEYTNLTGYTMAELEVAQEQSDLLPFFHPDDQARVNQHFKEVLDDFQQQGVSIEYRFRHKNGDWRWFYSRDAIYNFDESGNPNTMIGSFFDITELKMREQEISNLALEYATTFEQAGVGIAHVGMDGRFIKVNEKLADILGYEIDELVSKTFKEITYQNDVTKSLSALKELRAGNISTYETEKRYVRKQGQVIWAHLTASIVGPDSSEPYFISIIEDITHRKEIEKRLTESNTSLERFAYSASHDLQEPLRKISAFSGAVERRIKQLTNDDEVIGLLDRVSNAASRMSNMIDNLLELSRATRTSVNLSHVSLSSVIAISLDDLSAKLTAVNAKVLLTKDTFMDIDPQAFNQIIRNLISNSVNYRHADIPLVIRLEVERDATFYNLYFSDNGTGIPEEKAKLVFEPFQRLVGREQPGTGMGLAICKQLIAAHQGRISLAKSRLGGATFLLQVPVVTTIEA